MVLAAIWEEQIRRKALAEGREKGREEAREKGREKGRREGRRENQALWLDWNRRRLEAEEKGEAFHEPTPALNNNRNGSSR